MDSEFIYGQPSIRWFILVLHALQDIVFHNVRIVLSRFLTMDSRGEKGDKGVKGPSFRVCKAVKIADQSGPVIRNLWTSD